MPVYMTKILWFQGYLALKILQRLKYFQSINFKVQLIFLTVGGSKIDGTWSYGNLDI